MASIKKKSSGGGGANWMDTYGDMVTLLLCFFVLLYSISTIDEQKWMLIVQSFNKDAQVSTDEKPLGPEGTSDQEMGDDMPMLQDEVNEQVEMILEYLAEYAAGQSDSTAVTYSVGDGYLFISFNDNVFFRGDSYTLLPAGREALLGLCPLLNNAVGYIDKIVVDGHTATAVGTYDPYKDWHLSANRAAEVVAFLYENTDINPARFNCQGNGQWLPIAGNDVESERRKNRRVELMISFSEEELEGDFSGSIAEYYSMAQQDNPGLSTSSTAAE